MRETLFRGKRLDNGEWVYGDLYHRKICGVVSPTIHNIEYTGGNVDPATVGQYTGLQDKNGNKIFEGDILRIKAFRNHSMGLKLSNDEANELRDVFTLEELKGELTAETITDVCWDDCAYTVTFGRRNDTDLGCMCGDMKRKEPIFDFEVIGNIHDNPDLLKEARPRIYDKQ